MSEFIKGTYTINNGILTYNVKEWNIIDSSAYPNGSFSSMTDQEIQFEGNQLYLRPLNKLTRISGTGDNIWGEWYSTSWSISYFPSKIDPAVLYNEETIYKFNKESMTISYGIEKSGEPIDSVHFATDKIEYNLPNIRWGLNNDREIKFYNGGNNMLLKTKFSVLPLTKVNN